MSKNTILYTHEIASAHRLQGHPGKCAHLHGHNYIITFELEDRLNKDDMVMDFGHVKRILGGYLDEHYDHATLLQFKDPLYDAIKLADEETKFILFYERPTAEMIATQILQDCNMVLRKHNKDNQASYNIVKVIVQESTGQSAVAIQEEDD